MAQFSVKPYRFTVSETSHLTDLPEILPHVPLYRQLNQIIVLPDNILAHRAVTITLGPLKPPLGRDPGSNHHHSNEKHLDHNAL